MDSAANHLLQGAWNNENTKAGIQVFSLFLLVSILGWSVEAVEMLLIDVRKDLDNKSLHRYWSL